MLRRDRLCPKPEYCFDSVKEEGLDPLPCSNCPEELLNEYLASPRGAPFRGALEIDFALRAGFTVTLDDVNCWEFGLLRLLELERQRHEKQEHEKLVRKAQNARR